MDKGKQPARIETSIPEQLRTHHKALKQQRAELRQLNDKMEELLAIVEALAERVEDA